jgi:hypothetical protein
LLPLARSTHVQKRATSCIFAAKTLASDPFSSVKVIDGVKVNAGAYFWRTDGHAGPGGNTVAIPENLNGLIAYNRFYAIKK